MVKVERSPAVTRCGQYDVACAGGGAGGSVGSYSCSAPHLHLAQRAPRYGEGRDCNPYLGPIRHYDFICFNCLGTWMGGWGVSPISTRLHHTFRTRTTGHLGSPTRLWVSCGCVPAPPGVLLPTLGCYGFHRNCTTVITNVAPSLPPPPPPAEHVLVCCSLLACLVCCERLCCVYVWCVNS